MRRALVTLSFLACRSHDSTPAPTPEPPKVTATDKRADPLAVSLVNAGAEPRHLVRYTLAKGVRVDLELALDESLTSGAQGGAMPTLVFDLDMTVEDVLADGSFRLRSTIASVHARDRDGAKVPASSLAGKLDAVVGISIVGTMRPDGRLLDSHIELGSKTVPDTLAAQLASLAQSLQNVTTPLPTEPIGAGAVWKTTSDVDQNGLKATTVSTTTARAVDDHSLTFDVASEMHGPDQKVVQQNTPVEVSHLNGSASGHAVVDTAKLVMTGDFDSAFHADMTAMGQASPIDMHAKISITARDAGAATAPDPTK